MAQLYARYAWSAFSEANWEEFRDLTAKGLEFDPYNPDLMSFQGLLFTKEKKYQDASESYEKAYQQKTETSYIGRMEILASLSEIYYRLGQYQALTDLYSSVNRMYKDHPDFLFYTVQAFYREGRMDKAIALAEEGVYRYQDQRFLILLCGWLENSGYPAILSEFIERQGLLYPELFARTILNSAFTDERLYYLYVSSIRDLNSWFFSSIKLNLNSETHLLPGVDPKRVWPVTVIKALWDEQLPSSLLRSLDTDQTLLVDTTGDGIPNWELASTKDGFLWLKDDDQDGQTDFRIFWNSDLTLKSIENYNPDYRVLCHYYDYPHVESVNISGPGRTVRSYLFLPTTYDLPVNRKGMISWTDMIELESRDLPPWLFAGEADHLKACYSLKDRVVSSQGSLFRDYTVINGTISRFREDSNFDGHFDRTVMLKDWMPVEGYRDLDLDGHYDLKENYLNGRLVSLEVQGDKSRIEEYYDLWNSKRYQLWDFDRTSFYDAVLIEDANLTWTEKKLNTDIFMQSDNSE